MAVLVRPILTERAMLRRDLPVLIGATLIASVFLLDGVVARWEAGVLLGVSSAASRGA